MISLTQIIVKNMVTKNQEDAQASGSSGQHGHVKGVKLCFKNLNRTNVSKVNTLEARYLLKELEVMQLALPYLLRDTQ